MAKRDVTRRLLASAVAAAVGITGTHAVADITLNNGDTQNYTPAASTSDAGLNVRQFSGKNVNDTSLVDFNSTAASVGVDTEINRTTLTGTTAFDWNGKLQITTGGTYTFNTRSDDGSRLFIDGVLVINNEGGHGAITITNTINLGAGLHDFRAEVVNNAGGGSMIVSYSGADNSDTLGVIPGSVLFQAENTGSVSTTVGPSNITDINSRENVSLAASAAATLNLNGTDFVVGGLGTLDLGAGSSLTFGGDTSGATRRTARFNATTLNGAATYTLNTGIHAALGAVSGSASGTTITKLGAGRLILDNTASANDLAGATFDVQAGELYVIGSSLGGSTNPLGAAAVQLNGGTLSLDTKLGNYALSNTVTLASGASGTIRGISGPRSITIGDGSTAINIDGGQTLTLNMLGGSNTVDGATVIIDQPITGTGTLFREDTSVGGSRLGIAVLARNNAGFSGPVDIASGALEGRAATITDKPFGTGGITMQGGQLNVRGGGAAGLTYAVGNNVQVNASASFNASNFGGGATNANSVFAMGTLTTDGAYTLTMDGSNGYGFSFGDTSLGGNTTFAVNSGEHTVGTISAGASAITKSGGGTLALQSDNSYTGGTTISGGVLVAPVLADEGVASSLGSTGNITLSGGTLRYTGATDVTTGRQIRANNTAGGAIDVVNPTVRLTLMSDYANGFAGNTGSSVRKLGPGTLVIDGTADNNSLGIAVLEGTVELNKTPNSPVRAVAAITDIAPGATLKLTGAGNDQIYGGSATGQNSQVRMSGGTFDFNGKSEGFSRLVGVGTVTNNAPGTTSVMTLGETNGTGGFSGTIKDGPGGGVMTLRKVGTGTLTLGKQVHSYTGGTQITGGTLRLESTAAVTGAAVWLDASDTSSVGLAGAKVSTWTDLSGNGRNATQTTDGNRPATYTANANVGGKNTVNFTGTNQFLRVDLSFLDGSPYSIFVVEGKAATGNRYFLGTQTSTANKGLHVGYRTDTQYTLAQYSNDLNYTDASLAYDGSTQVFRLWSNILDTGAGGGHSISLGGSEVIDNTNTTPLSGPGPGVIGQGHTASTQYLGGLGEIIIFPSALSPTDADLIEAYLANKWLGGSVNGSGGLPATTAVSITGDGILDLNNNDQTIGSLTGVAGTSVTLGTGRLTVGDATTSRYGGTIAGTGGVTKQGSGRLYLDGASTYTGPTAVTAGELIIKGSLGNTAVTVSGTGTLGGGGSIAGPVSIASGGTVAPGESVGILYTGDLSLTAGATYGVELDPTNSAGDGIADQLNVTGTVALGGSDLLLSLLSAPTLGQTFTIIANDSNDPVSGQFAQGATVTSSFLSTDYHFAIDYVAGDGNDVVLTNVPVPEPTGLALAGIAATGLLSRRRRPAR